MLTHLSRERFGVWLRRVRTPEYWTGGRFNRVLSYLAVAISLCSAYFAWSSNQTAKVSAYLAQAQVQPILTFEWDTPVRHAKRYSGEWTIAPDSALIIHNVGALAIQRPRVEVMTFAVFARRDSATARDQFARMPIRYWFARHKHIIPPTGAGSIAVLGTDDSCAALPIWTRTSEPRYPLKRIASVVHLVVLSYRDALQDNQTDFFLVSPWDYALISDNDGSRLWTELQSKLDRDEAVDISHRWGSTLPADSLADRAFRCSVPEAALDTPVIPDSLDARRTPGYPPRERLRVRTFY